MSAKEYLISFTITSLISVLLWYRNKGFDRSISPYLFILGFSDLVIYGFHSQANRSQVSKALLFLSALQLLFLSFAIYFTTSSTIQIFVGYLTIFLLIGTIAVGFYLFSSDSVASFSGEGGSLNFPPILSVIYCSVLLTLLILLNFQYRWSNLGLTALLIVLFCASFYYNGEKFFLNFPRISPVLCLIAWVSAIEI